MFKKGQLVKKSHIFPQMIIAVLLLAFIFGNPGQKPVQAAPPAQEELNIRAIKYILRAFPGSKYLCVGQTYKMLAFVDYTVEFSRGSQAPFTISSQPSGEVVEAFVRTPSVGKISPASQTTSSVNDYVEFEFTALNVGQTIVRFVHTGSDNPLVYDEEVGEIPLADYTDTKVIVTPCYEAYAGAGILNYTKKDICSLDRSFELAGFSLGTEFGVTANQQNKTQSYRFTPNLIDPGEGRFVLKDRMTVPQVGCTIYINGTYVLEFYAQSSMTEGNIVMTGAGTMVCDNGSFSEHPNANPQIAFRALPQGVACSP